MTPQSCFLLGGHGVQGGSPQEAGRFQEEAITLQDAGAALLVLECLPTDLAAEIVASLEIPVMGAGAGIHCDGQILLAYDVLGLSGNKFGFAKNYLEHGAKGPLAAFRQFAMDARMGQFPGEEHCFGTRPRR